MGTAGSWRAKCTTCDDDASRLPVARGWVYVDIRGRAPWEPRLAQGEGTEAHLLAAIGEGAVMRVRPKAMTVAVIIAGLVPILVGAGTGSEVMQRIAAPMVGGMVTAPLLSMLVVPAAYYLLRRRRTRPVKVADDGK